MYDEIIYEVDDPVATIMFNRPASLNAWTPSMWAEASDAIAAATRDRRVVGIVLTGSGRGFCAGADMNVLRTIIDGTNDRLTPPVGEAADASWGEDFQGTYTWLLAVPKPVIACINGAWAGMGVPIALAADLRFAAEDAILTTAFSQRGLIAEWGVSVLMSRLVGPAVAFDLLASSRRIDGREAARLGLVNEAVPGDQLLARARAYVEHLASTCSPQSLAVIKRQVNQHTYAGLGPAEREAVKLMLESFGRPDFREGVASFMEKRPPAFERLGD